MSTKAIVAVVAAGAVAAVAIVVLSGGEESSARLEALRDDPMGRYEPEGAELVDTDAQTEGTTLGKPRAARYTRMFELTGGDGEQALGSALAAARKGGWTIENDGEKFLGDLVALGRKRLPTGDARLSLTLFTGAHPVPGGVSAPALYVSLEHLNS